MPRNRGITSLIASALAATTAGVALPAAPAAAVVKNTRVVVNLLTGDDDLRGGNDNLNVTLRFRTRVPHTRLNVNQGRAWGNQTWQQVILENDPHVPEFTAEDITGVELTTTSGGGVGGDNWNLDRAVVSFEEEHWDGRLAVRALYRESGAPLFRFTGERRTHLVRVDRVLDGGFEGQRSRTVAAPWHVEGPDAKGIDIGRNLSRAGNNNAFVSSSTRGQWNALSQQVPLKPNTDYVLRGFLRSTRGVDTAFFGVRLPGVWPPRERQWGPSPEGAYQQLEVRFNSGAHTTGAVFAGFWSVGTYEWLQIDDVSLMQTSF
ncbi:hypothetical protein SMC26_19430 [Actinomadura fulvescens]|uniref:Uncharacterized protein n=1 Tax=Actinomadura fulvescens TaxID=46160 RepID=A0ABP6CTN2_9ACTN